MPTSIEPPHQEGLPSATPQAFLEGWVERRQKELAPASHVAYKARIKDFLEWLGDDAKGLIAGLEKRHFIEYRNDLAKRVMPSTANLAIKMLRVPFEEARREGFIHENPAKDCPVLKTIKGTRRRPFTIPEINKLLNAADPEWRSMVLCGIYTGQRLSDLARLIWSNVDEKAQEIHLRTRKTGRMVRIPIVNPLADHLKTLAAHGVAGAHFHPRSAAVAKSGTLSRQFSDLRRHSSHSMPSASNPRRPLPWPARPAAVNRSSNR